MSLVKQSLQRAGVYERLRQSSAADAYWRWSGSPVADLRARELAHYRALVPAPALIFDIGANAGDKTDVFLRLGALVVAVDPDPTNLARLRRRFHDYRRHPLPVTLLEAAVSASVGTAAFWIDAPGSAFNTLSDRWADVHGARASRIVQTTTLDTLIQTYGMPAFIKIDVEGAERLVLRGLTQPVPLLSFEVNLPTFRDDGAACLDRLAHLAPGQCSIDGLRWYDPDDFRARIYPQQNAPIDVYWRHSEAPGGSVKLTAR